MTRIPLTDTSFVFGLVQFVRAYLAGTAKSRAHTHRLARSDKQQALRTMKGIR